MTAASAPRREDVDFAATLALTAVTLVAAVSLGRLFGDGSFLGPVLTAAVAGHVIAYAGRRLQFSLAVTALFAMVAGVFLVSWLVLPETTAYGVPTGETLTVARDELRQALTEFRTVVAPVPVSKGYLLAAVIGTLNAAFMADWAAFRMRTLFEATVPSFTLFLFSAILGAARHQALSVGSYLAAVLLFLVLHHAQLQGTATAWFASRLRGASASLLQVGGVLGAVAVLAALTVGPNLPGADDPPLMKWRNDATEGPGGNRTTVSPLVDIKPRLQDRSGVEVFTVRANGRAYWRLTALDRFDGQIWSSEASYRRANGTLAADVPSRAPFQQLEQDYVIGPLSSIWLPAAYRAARVEGVERASYNVDSGSLISPADTSDGLTYQVVSAIPQPGAEHLDQARPTARDQFTEPYLDLPSDLNPRVVNEARAIVRSGGATTPYQAARALQDHFRANFTYDLDVPPGHSNDALSHFLFRSRRGYCEQFAGAYAVLARVIGLPARVGVGFTPGEVDANGVFHVQALHAHAWPEVYLAGYGWIAFEPTPGRGVPGGEGYTGVPEAQAAPDAPQTATTVPATPPTVPEQQQPQEQPPPTEAPDLESVPLPEEPDRPLVPAWAWWAAGLVLAVALVWGLGVPFLKRTRRQRRLASARRPGDRVLVAWTDATEALAQAGVPRGSSETFHEYAARTGASGRLSREGAGDLHQLANDAAAALYAGDELSAETVARAMGAANGIEHELIAQLSGVRRLWWHLDPRPLRPTAPLRRVVSSRRAQRAA